MGHPSTNARSLEPTIIEYNWLIEKSMPRCRPISCHGAPHDMRSRLTVSRIPVRLAQPGRHPRINMVNGDLMFAMSRYPQTYKPGYLDPLWNNDWARQHPG